MRSDQQTIPVLDLHQYRAGGDDRRRFVQGLGDALVDIGFFALESHGAAPALLARAIAAAEAVFALPEDVKLRYEDARLMGQRGYTAFGREHAKDQPAPDLKEFWHVGRDLSPGHPLRAVYADNLWPAEVPAFREVFTELYLTLDALAADLLGACALYAGEREGLFREMARDGDSVIRVLHYPPVPEGAHPASIRAAAHEDINLMTLLSEATAPGLELLQRDGRWRPVRAFGGQIVVDTGDMMQHVTNGLFKATTHRVVNPDAGPARGLATPRPAEVSSAGPHSPRSAMDDGTHAALGTHATSTGGTGRERRFSMPFFVHPRPEVSLAPLASCVAKTGGAARFEPLSAGEFLERRLRDIGLGAGAT
jgi:isopenicillin N synthase-like dioxygenase